MACNQGTSKNTADTTTIGYSDSATQVADSTHPRDRKNLNYKVDTSAYVTRTLQQPHDTLLTMQLQNGKGSVDAYINGIGKHVTIVVPVTGGDSITGQLQSDDDTANIRFTQIFIPVGKQGKFDGPFSRTISYPVTVKGNYKLIIGENLMTGTDWKGNFRCIVQIK